MLQQLIQERPDDSLEKIFFGGEKSPSAPSKRFIVVSGTLPDRELDPRPMLGIRFLAALTHQCCTVISAKRGILYPRSDSPHYDVFENIARLGRHVAKIEYRAPLPQRHDRGSPRRSPPPRTLRRDARAQRVPVAR